MEPPPLPAVELVDESEFADEAAPADAAQPAEQPAVVAAEMIAPAPVMVLVPPAPASAPAPVTVVTELARVAPEPERVAPKHVAPQQPRADVNRIEAQQPPSPWVDVDIRYDDAKNDKDTNENNANANANAVRCEPGSEIERVSEIVRVLKSDRDQRVGCPRTKRGAEPNLQVQLDRNCGNGIGTGTGAGIGAGVDIGRGAMRDIAALRVPEPSKARPAKLLHPTRETEVDAAELYVAIITVDTDGDVVGARMTRSHPGSRGDTAASMIWQFRYSPALDDAGNPVRSTFEQPFAVR
jgi:hypothetical protein